jgi:beta-N-acetylhexosaminidase
MNLPLTTMQTQWVERTLRSMSLEECVGHLLCPEDRNYTLDAWKALLDEIPLGCVFLGRNTPERLRESLTVIQQHARIPVLVASDLEHGAGCMVSGGATDFPWAMACGAANDPELMRVMGRATAREGRALGLHWTFSPVVDLNINFRNPVVNVRALGDDAERVSRLVLPWIQGMQADGLLAACAKHFPGDGMDDRDQHLCTSVNSATIEAWWASYGKVWKTAIDGGVMSIMSGHIAFPAYEGLAGNPLAALPATLSRRLQVELLRGELGFQGVIVSDAAPMIGITSRVSAAEEAVENILSGSDVYLFADPRNDFAYLLHAVKTGRLSEAQLYASVRRVLEMKARLNLFAATTSPAPADEERAGYQHAAQHIADKSMTVARTSAALTRPLPPGANVLTVTVKMGEASHITGGDLACIDDELTRRGYQVDHLLNPSHNALIEKVGQYDRVYLNLIVLPHGLIGNIRLIGAAIMTFWRGFWVGHDNVVITSFGSPYHLYELPHLPNMLLAYSWTEHSQRAAVKVWLGEMAADADCPVTLPVV